MFSKNHAKKSAARKKSLQAADFIFCFLFQILGDLLVTHYLLHVFLEFRPGKHNAVAAASADDPEIRSHTEYLPVIGPAGMLFFHVQNIVYPDIHMAPSYICFTRSLYAQ